MPETTFTVLVTGANHCTTGQPTGIKGANSVNTFSSDSLHNIEYTAIQSCEQKSVQVLKIV